MSDAPAADKDLTKLCDAEAIEERRATRNMKFWMVKAVTTSFMFVLVVSVLSLVYSAVIQDKDLNTWFLGEVIKSLYNILVLILG